MRLALRFSIGILLAGIALRSIAMLDDFWLDEIWSYNLAHTLSSPLGVFTEARVDNNHPLNTLFLYFLGEQSAWTIYRIPAVLFGVGTIVLAGLLARSRGPAAIVAVVLLLSVSFVHVTYSTEARGYAPAAFFALATLLWARRVASREPTFRDALTLWLLVSLGSLAHLTYLPTYAAVATWTIWIAPKRSWSMLFKRAALLHGVPLALLLAYYSAFVSKLSIGGGIQNVALRSIAQSFSLVVGGPMDGVGLTCAAVAVLLAVFASLWGLFKHDANLAILFLLSAVLMPAIFGAVWAWRSDLNLVAVRTFFIPIVLMTILLGQSLGVMLTQARWRPIAGGIALVILAGNAIHVARFLGAGRGHYLAAVDYLAANDLQSVIRVASDQPYRAKVVLAYYERFVPPGVRIAYIDQLAPGEPPPTWIIIHAKDDLSAEPRLTFSASAIYDYRQSFAQYGLSGSRWHLYRLAA